MVGFSSGRVTCRNRCHRPAPSSMLASSSSTGRFCSAARNISMKVPEVVQTTSVMIAHIATLGPESQSHQDSPNRSAGGQRGGRVESTPTAPSSDVQHAARSRRTTADR